MKNLRKFIDVALKEINQKMSTIEEKLREDSGDDLDEEKLVKALECQKVVMLIQAVIKGGAKWLETKNIQTDVAISLAASNLDLLTKGGDPTLICNYTYMNPETLKDLEYHMEILYLFLEAKEFGWKTGVYTQKDVKAFREKVEKQAEEYEQFTIRGKL